MKAKKSKVYSVRFDNEKLDFLQGKVKELVSGQQIVDYLLNKYWWDNKVPIVTAREAPPLHLKEDNQHNIQLAKPDMVNPPVHFKTLAQYSAEKRELETEDQYNAWLAELNADMNYSKKQKDLIIKYN